MIHNIPNYSWPFKLDEVFNYAYWDNFLSKKECDQIVSMGKIKGLKSLIFSDSRLLDESL